MMPKMTREQFEAMSFEEFMDWARENIDDLTDEETLIQFAKEKIDDDSFNVAIHILTAIWEKGIPDVEDWRYDYSMGTCETPTPVTCKEDLEDLIDFDEEDEEEVEIDTLYHDCSEEELRKMGCFGNSDEEVEDDRSELPWDYGKHFD